MLSRDLDLVWGPPAESSTSAMEMEEDLGFALSPGESGIFSASDELTEEELVALSPEGVQVQGSSSSQSQPSRSTSLSNCVVLLTSITATEAKYDALLEKYLELANVLSKSRSCEVPDPFRIVDYDEMLEVLIMTPDRSGMHVTAKLLDFALQVFIRQTDLGNRYMNRLLDIIGQTSGRSGRRQKTVTQAEACSSSSNMNQDKRVSQSDDMGLPDSQESGFGDDVNFEDESISCSQSPGKILRHLRQSKGKKKGTFLSHDGSILFDFSTASPDVVTRRKLLHVKFQELASDLYNSYFDMHHIYGSEMDVDSKSFEAAEVNADATPFFRYLFDKSQNKAGEMSQLALCDSIDNYQSEVESRCSTPVRVEDNYDNGASGETYSSMESENFLASVMDCFNSLIQEQENQNENATTDKEHTKDSRKQRGPLEPINEPLKNIILDNEEMEPETKRARMSDPDENFDMSSLFLNGPLHSDMEAINQIPEMPWVSGWPSLNTDDVSDEPMPLFDECAANTRIPQRSSRQVNVKKVIGQLENTIVDEFEVKNNEEIQFIELILKSKLNMNMMPPADGEATSSTANDSAVSVPMAFLALLHVAHSKSLYLEPADEDLVTVTKRRPAEEVPPADEDHVTVTKRRPAKEMKLPPADKDIVTLTKRRPPEKMPPSES